MSETSNALTGTPASYVPSVADRAEFIRLSTIRAHVLSEAALDELNSKNHRRAGDYTAALRDEIERLHREFEAIEPVLERIDKKAQLVGAQ